MFVRVICVLILGSVVAPIHSERHEVNARMEQFIEDRKGTLNTSPGQPVSVGEGNDVIGYIVVPYPGPYPGLESRSDFSSLLSFFNPAKIPQTLSNYGRRMRAAASGPVPTVKDLNGLNIPLASLATLSALNPYPLLTGYHGLGGLNLFGGLNAYQSLQAQQQLRNSLIHMLGR